MTEVLLVDDDERILGSFERYLLRKGFSVLTAKNGFEALELLKTHTPDLVISDVRMPRMDGIELMKKMPVEDGLPPGRIIFTAFDDGEAMELARMSEGGIFRVEKDRWETDLQPAIARALELRDFMLELMSKAEEKLQNEKELAELKAEQELSKMQNIFVVSINHEFRTPLTGVIGFSETILRMLENKNLTWEKLKGYAQHILDSGNRLAKLLNDVAELLVIAKGVRFVTEEISLPKLMEELFAEVAELTGGKNLDLETDFPQGLPLVKADRKRLTQILMNVFDNAVKFTEEGTVRISAKNSGGCVTVSISDTGIGIAESELPTIFERFNKIDDSGFKSGTGLGLYICENLIELMGGRIWVESELGKGVTCNFTLPAVGVNSEFCLKPYEGGSPRKTAAEGNG
ncbi:MAG: hypothetical protein IEMM0002_0696 [bacterium]|nr:MAG: hypothetical protein IEMM0002_0696 [bacterium]